MNKEEPYREQAERLKQRIEKFTEQIDEQFESGDFIPPREQLHRKKKKKIKWKLKYPVIRLLVLLFILLPVIIFSVISYFEGNKTSGTVKTTVNPVGETINLEKPKQDDQQNTQSEAQKQMDANQGNNYSQVPNEKSEQANSEVPQPVQSATNTEKNTPAQTPVVNQGNTSQKAADKNSQASQQTAKDQTKPKPQPRVIYHTVQPKENLFAIARRYYHSPKNGMRIISQANHLRSDQLKVGQVLKIPLNE
jgi:cytoskeletal protein RodZ